MTVQEETSTPNTRTLAISDLERVARFRVAGYGGAVSDALLALGVRDTVLSERFKALSPGQVLTGRAVTVKIHSQVGGMEAATLSQATEEELAQHPQRRMMRVIDEAEDGTVLCFDCGGDTQAAHFGEMSSQLVQAHGCCGLLISGYCRDTRYVEAMTDFSVFCFGTRPNAFGGWTITDVNVPIFMPGHLTHYVEVQPGDFVFADSDGTQLIPSELVDEVLLRVEATFAEENELRERIAAGMSVDDVYKEYGVL